jgi:hypothetical protein
VSHGERPDAPVEGGRPRSGDGALLCALHNFRVRLNPWLPMI